MAFEVRDEITEVQDPMRLEIDLISQQSSRNSVGREESNSTEGAI